MNITNMKRLRDFLAQLPPETNGVRTTHMQRKWVWTTSFRNGDFATIRTIRGWLGFGEQVMKPPPECGTAACLAGWAAIRFGHEMSPILMDADAGESHNIVAQEAKKWLGLKEKEDRLFQGDGFGWGADLREKEAPNALSRGIRELDRLITLEDPNWPAELAAREQKALVPVKEVAPSIGALVDALDKAAEQEKVEVREEVLA